jgi:very-short-patch-repair endonuclease
MARATRTWVPSRRPLNASERRLITLLKSLNLTVVPQATDGRWTVDAFLPPPISAVVEVDGPAYHTRSEDAARDRARERDLQADGLLVIRAWSPDLYSDVGRAKVRKHILTRLFRERGIRLKARGAERLYGRLEE